MGQTRQGGQPITTFEVKAGSGHTAMVDEAPVFGDDLGMRPTEMLLGALGSCTGVNAVPGRRRPNNCGKNRPKADTLHSNRLL